MAHSEVTSQAQQVLQRGMQGIDDLFMQRIQQIGMVIRRAMQMVNARVDGQAVPTAEAEAVKAEAEAQAVPAVEAETVKAETVKAEEQVKSAVKAEDTEAEVMKAEAEEQTVAVVGVETVKAEEQTAVKVESEPVQAAAEVQPVNTALMTAIQLGGLKLEAPAPRIQVWQMRQQVGSTAGLGSAVVLGDRVIGTKNVKMNLLRGWNAAQLISLDGMDRDLIMISSHITGKLEKNKTQLKDVRQQLKQAQAEVKAAGRPRPATGNSQRDRALQKVEGITALKRQYEYEQQTIQQDYEQYQIKQQQLQDQLDRCVQSEYKKHGGKMPGNFRPLMNLEQGLQPQVLADRHAGLMTEDEAFNISKTRLKLQTDGSRPETAVRERIYEFSLDDGTSVKICCDLYDRRHFDFPQQAQEKVQRFMQGETSEHKQSADQTLQRIEQAFACKQAAVMKQIGNARPPIGINERLSLDCAREAFTRVSLGLGRHDVAYMAANAVFRERQQLLGREITDMRSDEQLQQTKVRAKEYEREARPVGPLILVSFAPDLMQAAAMTRHMDVQQLTECHEEHQRLQHANWEWHKQRQSSGQTVSDHQDAQLVSNQAISARPQQHSGQQDLFAGQDQGQAVKTGRH